MSNFKKMFHLRSESLPSASTPQKENAGSSPLQRARTSNLPSDESRQLRTHRSVNFKDYIISFKSKRFLSLRSGRAPRTPTNHAASSSAFSAAVTSASSPITSLFTPRPAVVSSARAGSGKRQIRNHRQYSIDLSHGPVPPSEQKEPDTAAEGDTDAFGSADLDVPKASPYAGGGSPLDTVRLARRRSKATRNSAGHSPSLALPQRPPTSPLATARTSYPLLHPEPLTRSDADLSHSSVWAPPAYRSRSGTSRNMDNSSLRVLRSPPGSPSRRRLDSSKSAPHRAAEILQQATGRILADPAFSQSSIFRTLAPFVVFLSLLALAAIIPRYHPLEGHLASDVPCILLFIIAGVTSTLLVLKFLIWTVGVFATSFCEADLCELFRKRGLIDANGTRMAEGDMVTALF